MNASSVNFIREVAAAALPQLPSLVAEWLPGGHREGHEYRAGSVNGGSGRSFSVNLESGAFSEFNGDSPKGGDAVSLYATTHGLTGQLEAARRLAEIIGYQGSSNGARLQLVGSKKGKGRSPSRDDDEKKFWECVMPVPPSAGPPGTAAGEFYKTIIQSQQKRDDSIRFDYRSASSGELLFCVYRFENVVGEDGKVGKQIRPLSYWRHRESGRLEWRHWWPPSPLPLYGLERLAQYPDLPVIILAGEKKCDAAWEKLEGRYVCLSIPSGDGAVDKRVDWSSLRGRRIALWPDNDASCYAAMIKAAHKIGHDDVSIVKPDGGWSKKHDIGDLIDEGWSADRLVDFITDSAVTVDSFERCMSERFPAASSNKPQIQIIPGNTTEMVNAAECALIPHASDLRIFQRAGHLVRIIRLDCEVNSGGLKRVAGTVQLTSAHQVFLQEIFERLIAWQKWDGRKAEWMPAYCPKRCAETYAERREWGLPVITGVIHTPIVRPADGSILNTPGYDPQTGLYLEIDSPWLVIPEKPTYKDAQAALARLYEPFNQFPFVDDSDKSVLLAAIMTALERSLLDSAPFFGFDAPQQRSGKSMRAEAVGLLATGYKPAASGLSRNSEEFRKVLLSILMEGHAVVNFDNIPEGWAIDSPDLARAITQKFYSDRVLATHDRPRLPTNIFFGGSGNNMLFRGDMKSRALISRIDAKMENPEERTFTIKDLPAYLLANRKQLVVDALTPLRAYHLAERPRQDVKPWGGFDQWSREIREPLIWLGWADPCETRKRIASGDPDRDETLAIFEAWNNNFPGYVAKTSSEIIAAAQGEDDNANKLKAALLTVAESEKTEGTIDSRRFAHWCRRMLDRVIANFCLVKEGKDGHAARWRLTVIEEATSRPPEAKHKDSVPKQEGAADKSKECVGWEGGGASERLDTSECTHRRRKPTVNRGWSTCVRCGAWLED